MMASRTSATPVLALLAASLACTAALVASACLDVTPIVVPPKEAGSVDGGCTLCLERPASEQGCREVLDRCRADLGCQPVLACVEALGCFDLPAIDDKLNCGLPCIQDAGITSVDDPRVAGVLNVVKCGQTTCGVACNLGDGGFAFDAL
jgi:hypothetical protein